MKIKAVTKTLLLTLLPFFLFGQSTDGSAPELETQTFCSRPTGTSFVHWNNLKMTLTVGGEFTKEDIEVTGLPSSLIYHNGLWLSATQNGSQRVAAADMTPEIEDNRDYWAGPLDTNGDEFEWMMCDNFDRFWRVNYNEVANHIQDFEDDGEINDTPATHILAWPGRGNPNFAEFHDFELPDLDLAPFIDRNQNGVYEPMEGDYPRVRGSWNMWKIINDASTVHTISNGNNGRWVASVLYYAQVSEPDNILANTYFTEIEVLSRGTTSSEDMTVGFFADFNPVGVEAVGCNPEGNYAYSFVKDFNSSSTEDTQPALVMTKIMEANEDLESDEFSGYMYYVEQTNNSSEPMSDPQSSYHYNNIARQKWKDGTDLTQGGNGYGGTVPTNFAYPDAPNEQSGWSDCSTDEVLNKRSILSVNLGTLQTDERGRVTLAHVFIPDFGVGCENFEILNNIANNLEQAENTGPIISKISIVQNEGDLKITPNPFSDSFTIKIENEEITKVEVYSTTGSLIKTKENIRTQETHFDVSETISSGIYFLKIETSTGKVYSQKIIKL